MQTDLLTSVLDLTGVFANGLLGGAVARSQGMDLFGFGALGLISGLGWLPAVLLGTITAVGGGVTRDMILVRVPSVFTEGPLYATVALFVAAVQVLCARTLGPGAAAGTTVAIAAGFALRLVAYRRGWRLPRGLEWQPRRIGQRADPGDHDEPARSS